MDVLRELVDSRYTVYDVLPTFWNYTDQEIIHGELYLIWNAPTY